MNPLRWPAGGLGLRARMAASYVLATLAAVVLVEGLAAALVLPNVNQEQDLRSRALNTAGDYASRYQGLVNKVATRVGAAKAAGEVPLAEEQVAAMIGSQTLGDPVAAVKPGQASIRDNGVLIPQVNSQVADGPISIALILDPGGQVFLSSYPARYPPGSQAAEWLPRGWGDAGTGVTKLADGRVAWASVPIWQDLEALGKAPDPAGKGTGKGPEKPPLLGFAYVQVPLAGGAPSWSTFQPFLQSGAVFLLATIPVGAVFGLLTTRGTIRRLRRLAAATVGVAAGDLGRRVPESGGDEVGMLERHFNRMAGRLQDSIARQRALAERNARLAERSRISRELHDSISQDLFSIGALVGGLRRALPEGAAVQPQLETLAATAESTIREMRALLLELRPTALEEKGLVAALTDLCEAYEVRVGVRVRPDLEPVAIDPAAEQALFRIAQEGLSNAVRHSEAAEIGVRLRQREGEAELTVADDGRGFDRDRAAGHGLGLRLMAERVRELGGSLAVESRPGRGTELRVLLPAAAG
jgi:signal transduction histidine kinase